MIKAVISGSYHRDSSGLQRLFAELETCGVRVLSPLSINFIDTTKPVVTTPTDEDMDISMLEQLHLRALREADVLFLHAPEGYVGISTSFEIGYAAARHLPVVTTTVLQDEMLQTVVTVRARVFEALSNLGLI